MGQNHFGKCWAADEHALGGLSSMLDDGNKPLKSNDFQICKKGQIQSQTIEIEMLVSTHL